MQLAPYDMTPGPRPPQSASQEPQDAGHAADEQPGDAERSAPPWFSRRSTSGPVAAVLHTQPLPPDDLAIAALAATTPAIVFEVLKAWRRRRSGRRSS